ncbi:MAG TPA: YbjN domain-containing protein [Acidimicrobiales bacterium]|nr:YbjN domain-containing protein [Acidimicrobiales bacterium]
MSPGDQVGQAQVPSGQSGHGSSFLTVLLEDALAANGLETWPVEGFPGVLTGSVEGTFGQWNFFAQGDEDSLGVVVYSVFPGNVTENRRLAVAELATRANYLLRYGSLEMDFSDGEVRARTSARGGPEALDFNVISELVRTNLEVAELFFPSVQEVAVEGAPPAKAISRMLERLSQG